jgi:hypothetical protein
MKLITSFICVLLLTLGIVKAQNDDSTKQNRENIYSFIIQDSPNDYTPASWKNIISTMAPRNGLNESQVILVRKLVQRKTIEIIKCEFYCKGFE